MDARGASAEFSSSSPESLTNHGPCQVGSWSQLRVAYNVDIDKSGDSECVADAATIRCLDIQKEFRCVGGCQSEKERSHVGSGMLSF